MSANKHRQTIVTSPMHSTVRLTKIVKDCSDYSIIENHERRSVDATVPVMSIYCLPHGYSGQILSLPLLLYHFPNMCLIPVWCMEIITIPWDLTSSEAKQNTTKFNTFNVIINVHVIHHIQ